MIEKATDVNSLKLSNDSLNFRCVSCNFHLDQARSLISKKNFVQHKIIVFNAPAKIFKAKRLVNWMMQTNIRRLLRIKIDTWDNDFNAKNANESIIYQKQKFIQPTTKTRAL